jgi:hypothetical protein
VDVIRQAELTNIRRPGEACGGTSAAAASSDVTGAEGTSTTGADGVAADLEGDALPPVVIAILVAAGLAIVAFVVYLVVMRRGRGNGDA